LGGDRSAVKIRFYFSVMVEKRRHIHNEISDYRKGRKRFDEGRLLQKALHMGSTSQNIFAIDSHRTGATYCPSAGIAESKCSILLILNTKQCLKEIHPLPDLHMEGFNPLGRNSLFVETFDF
jgi:hypothetical protein